MKASYDTSRRPACSQQAGVKNTDCREGGGAPRAVAQRAAMTTEGMSKARLTAASNHHDGGGGCVYLGMQAAQIHTTIRRESNTNKVLFLRRPGCLAAGVES